MNPANDVSKPKEPRVEDDYGAIKKDIQLRKSIYSAGTIKIAYLGSVFATFFVQIFILFVQITEEKRTFISTIGYDGKFTANVFKRALGRYICFVLILLKCQLDLQNSIDIMFTSQGAHSIICALLQLAVPILLPVAFVYAISNNTTLTNDIGGAGLLYIFIDMDTSIYNLILISKESSEEVRSLKMGCSAEWENIRKYSIGLVMPLYIIIFFFIVWYAAMEMYPPAFAFIACTFVIYLTPYLDNTDKVQRRMTQIPEPLELTKQATTMRYVEVKRKIKTKIPRQSDFRKRVLPKTIE